MFLAPHPREWDANIVLFWALETLRILLFPFVIHFSVILMIKLHFPECSLKYWEQWQQTVKTEAARYILIICLQKKITRAALSFHLPQWYLKHYSNYSILSATNSPPHRHSENSRKSRRDATSCLFVSLKGKAGIYVQQQRTAGRGKAPGHTAAEEEHSPVHLAGTSTREEGGTKENMLGLEHGWEEQQRSTGGKQQQCCCPCITVTLQLSASPRRTKWKALRTN